MSMGMPKYDFNRMSREERLRLLEELWQSLVESPDGVPVTKAQRAELNRRLDEMERGGVDGIPWEEVLRQIRERA